MYIKTKKNMSNQIKVFFYTMLKKRFNIIIRYFKAFSQLSSLRSIKIQTRLMVSFLLLSSIPLAITSLISYQKSSSAIQNKIDTYSVQVMTEVSTNLKTQLTYMESLCEELAMTDEIQKDLNNYQNAEKNQKFKIENIITSKFIEKMRLSSFNASSDITSINIVLDDNIIMGPGQNNYVPVQFNEIFNDAKSESYKYNYRVITDLNGDFEISIDKLVKSHENGKVIGTLILTFKESYISNICKELNVGERAEVFIMDSKGTIISSGNTFSLPVNKKYTEKNFIEKLQNSLKEKKYSFSFNIEGKNHLAAFHGIENNDWFIVSTIPYSYIQSESKALMWNIIFIALICLLFAIPVSFIISFSISVPLSKLKNIMDEAKKGNLNIELTDNNCDEIAEMTLRFNDMISSIRLLIKENIDTQKEIVFKLGAVTEARSQETGNHIRRVAHYSNLIALKYGIPEEEAEILKIASTLHDIGKISIPDNILLKPGKLAEEEFNLMKTHTLIGYEILSSSDKPIWKIASIIALEHHEKYDGTGYPKGLARDQIGIHSRIVALADVFDALGTDRVYKKKWELSKIVDYIKEQRGKQFDPEIVDIFITNLDSIILIKDKLKD